MLLQSQAADQIRTNEVDVLICSAGGNLTLERIEVASELWSNGIKAEILYKEKPKFLDQMNHCEKNSIPFAVILGEDELKSGVVKIKDVRNRDDKGVDVRRDQLVQEIKNRVQGESAAAAPSTSSSKSTPLSYARFEAFLFYFFI